MDWEVKKDHVSNPPGGPNNFCNYRLFVGQLLIKYFRKYKKLLQ